MENYQAPDKLLENRIILVTGAGDGIGRSAAITYAKYGATVILLGKTLAKLETVYDEIESLGYPTPAIYPLHMEGAIYHDYEEMAQKLGETFDRLDGILHNAAILPYLSHIKNYSMEDWMRVMQVNLNAPFAITQVCMPLLEKSSAASIIFTSDDVVDKGKAYWGAYAVSKAGQESMMQVLADELEHSNIRVNSLNPGATRTQLRKNIFPAEQPSEVKLPEKLMPLYLWLMGSDSKGTNGQCIKYK